MKNLIICLCILSFPGVSLKAQSLILKGSIRCVVQSPNTTKGAENVVVFPNFNPQKATRTASRPSGYFEINTGVPFSTLEDKVVTMHAISKCKDCEKMTRDVYITEDKDRQNKTDNNTYCTIKDWLLTTNCKQAEMKPHSTDSILKLAIKQSPQDLEKVSGATALVGSPTLLNFLTSAASVLAPTGPVGLYSLRSFEPGKISYGHFLFASPLSNSDNKGFNYAPNRLMSEAVFWNPSAMALNRKSGSIGLLTNVKNNFKLSGYHKLSPNIALGGGFIFTKQDEFRNISFALDGGFVKKIDSIEMNLKEYTGFISIGYRVQNNFSLGLSIKSIWQDFNVPVSLFLDNNNNVADFLDDRVTNQKLDIDLSASYKFHNALQIGLNIFNLAGSQINNDAFVTDSIDNYQNQRSIGLGLLYKWQRFNFGTDLLFANGGLYDIAFGVNYVPFNNALLSAGIAVKQLSYSLSFKIKYFRIAYINDNDFLINEKNKGKSAIFNGYIYGGFVFDLN